MTRCRQVRCEFTNAQLRVVGLVRCVLPEEETAGEAAGTHACSSNVDSSSKSTTTVGLILGVETARGVKVEAIIPGSPAFKTKSFQRGDVVAKINGVQDPQDRQVTDAVLRRKPRQPAAALSCGGHKKGQAFRSKSSSRMELPYSPSFTLLASGESSTNISSWLLLVTLLLDVLAMLICIASGSLEANLQSSRR